MAYHFLIAYWTRQTIASTSSGILTGAQQDLTPYVFPVLGGAGGTI